MAKTRSQTSNSSNKQPLKKTPKTQASSNPISKLYELKPGISFKTEQTGPVFNSTFTMEVNVDGRCFCGTGKSKKEAKYKASIAALEFLGHNPVSKKGKKKTKTKILKNKNIVSKQVAHASKLPNNVKKDIPSKGTPKKALKSLKACPVGQRSVEHWAKTNLGENHDRHPISKLRALHHQVTIGIAQPTSSAENASFKLKVTVNGNKHFMGRGKSKKLAELQAAFKALKFFEKRVPKRRAKTLPHTVDQFFQYPEIISEEERMELFQKQMKILDEVYPLYTL